MRTCLAALVLMLAVAAAGSSGPYLPVLCMHGLSYNNNAGTYHDYDDIIGWMKELRPEQLFLSLDINNGVESMTPMWTQLPEIVALIKSIVENNATFAGGYHLLGHSQGGLFMRSVLEVWPEHNVHTFVSMAGVQMGYYGLGPWTSFAPHFTEAALTDLLYTTAVQDRLSLANWWRDAPNLTRFYNEATYLGAINNELADNVTASYKTGFTRAQAMHYFGSPQDGTVVPWDTSLFSFFDASLNATIPMTEQPVFTEDLFGLQTMWAAGRLTLTAVPGIEHSQWLHNQTLFLSEIAPLLI
eukprot:c27570_g1_i1.p1 GENE.c27570_g1_i1~~c27570_g1_i1.p1  ORF type:complete len:299 (+),score=55.64 c27570_g1_i1:32-928(+)